MTLSHVTTPGQSGSGRDGNEEVLCIPQSTSITGASQSDLASYPGHSCFYSSTEKQSVYSTAPANRANVDYVWFTLVWWHIKSYPSAEMLSVNAKSFLYIYMVHSISSFFVQAFKIIVNSWQFSMLLLYILQDDRPIFMISGSNEQLQQQLEYTLLKPDCHSWWISKMQSGCEDTSEER